MRKIVGGLYRNVGLKVADKGRSATWHFQIKFRGKPYSGDTKHTSHEAAKKWLAQYKDNLADKGVGLITQESIPNLEKALDTWCKSKQGQVVDSHINDVRTAIMLHCKDYLGSLISEITNPVVEAIRSKFLSTSGSGYHGAILTHNEGGANNVVKHLKSVIRSNISTSMYDNRPLVEMPFKIEDLEVQESLKGIVWPEQVPDFLVLVRQSRNPHVYTSICLMLCLGLREDEALCARWEAVNWRNHSYVVAGDPAKKISTKTRKSREIPMSEWLEQNLQKSWEAAGRPLTGLMLPTKAGKKHFEGYTAKPIARCARRLGIQNLHPHVLRASFATGHFEVGTELSQIQQMMGHQSPETTLGYIFQRPVDQAISQERLAAKMGLKTKVTHIDIEYQI